MPLPTLPAPRTWVPNMGIKAPYLRADVADAIQLLTQPPVFAGGRTVTAQSIPNAAGGIAGATNVNLDTEFYDPWQMHLDNSAHPDRCYPSLAGFYLCQAFTPLAAVAGGDTGACIRVSSNGGAQTDWGGQTLINSSGFAAGPVACRLVKMQQVGAYGTGDYAGPSVFQTSGGAVNTFLSTTKYPTFSMRWIGSLTGTSGLPVPPLAAWPVPPAYVTSAFLNANIRDADRFLVYPPFGEWQFNGGGTGVTLFSQTAVPLVGTALPLDTAVCDSYTAMDLATSTWTAPVPGVYWTYGLLSGTATTTTVAIGAGLTVKSANYNGGTQITLWNGTQAAWPGSGFVNGAVFRRRLRLNAGDTIQLAGFSRDSASGGFTLLGSGSNQQTRLIIIWTGM